MEVGAREHGREGEVGSDRPDSLPFELTKRGLGFLIAALGAVTLARTLDAEIAGPVTLLYPLIAVLYGGVIVAGLLLIAKWRSGIWLGLAIMALHAPILRVWRFTYAVSLVPTMEIKLWPSFGFSFTFSNVMVWKWHTESQDVYLAVNGFACMLAGVFLHYAVRQADAYRRLTARGPARSDEAP